MSTYKSNHNLDEDMDNDDSLGMNMEALLQSKNKAKKKDKLNSKSFVDYQKRKHMRAESYLLSSGSSMDESRNVNAHYFKQDSEYEVFCLCFRRRKKEFGNSGYDTQSRRSTVGSQLG